MSNLKEFLSFGGYGFFVWGSYLVTAVVIAWEIIALRLRARRAVESARVAHFEET